MTELSHVIASFQRPLGTPYAAERAQRTRILLLGSGELGKEITIACMRLGAWVCAADAYEHAPAAQVAHEARVLDMSNERKLRALITQVQPDIIIPEVEAIATQDLAWAAAQGIQVVPSARIASICMDRKRLRKLAHEVLQLPTSPYVFANSFEAFCTAVEHIGTPCVVKPLMSSSGHGQSFLKEASEASLHAAWHEAQAGRRAAHEGEMSEVIVEAMVPIAQELTMLTVSSSAGISVCAPIGQVQDHGDYRQSWQPAAISPELNDEARRIATTIVEGLVEQAHQDGERGWGVFGVELFVLNDGSVLFNEVSPRPHDTGMVTLISQYLSEFALHARAVLGMPLTQEHLALALHSDANTQECAASQAIVVHGDGAAVFTHVGEALAAPRTDLRIFAKPVVHGERRMGVCLAIGDDTPSALAKVEHMAATLDIQIL